MEAAIRTLSRVRAVQCNRGDGAPYAVCKCSGVQGVQRFPIERSKGRFLAYFKVEAAALPPLFIRNTKSPPACMWAHLGAGARSRATPVRHYLYSSIWTP